MPERSELKRSELEEPWCPPRPMLLGWELQEGSCGDGNGADSQWLRANSFCSCRACKPNFVCRRGGRTVIPLGRALLRGSSDLPGSCGAPSRHARTPRRAILPYLVLLRVGFALPPPLLAARCALTAPVHPYLSTEAGGRYLLCGTFRERPLTAAPRTLSGTPLCGVRTFLYRLAPAATVRPSS